MNGNTDRSVKQIHDHLKKKARDPIRSRAFYVLFHFLCLILLYEE